MNTAKDPEIVIKEIRIGSKIYQVQDLFDLCGPKTLINRRSEPMSRLPKTLKYSRQERRWQATATLEEIQERYGLTRAQAQSMRYQARHFKY